MFVSVSCRPPELETDLSSFVNFLLTWEVHSFTNLAPFCSSAALHVWQHRACRMNGAGSVGLLPQGATAAPHGPFMCSVSDTATSPSSSASSCRLEAEAGGAGNKFWNPHYQSPTRVPQESS
eukprot:TRINITY_DN6914_c0_g2_i1.p1 TRINITY_DN6914_c0_g2~~TRINITY_DN6914_c0_g2_i1.p1  ORF type:complete len:122 (+),score=8.78 TRINITY_DN6914_c0_g2_i1:217-582(+)